MKLKETGLYILNKFWQFLAVVVILYAVLVTIARYSMPYLNNHRDSIEKIITQQSGLQINIGQIVGSWVPSGPVLEINNIKLGASSDNQDSTTNSIKSLKVNIKVLSSLFSWTLITDRLTIEGLSLAIEQKPSGKFTLPNISVNNVKTTAIDPESVSAIQDWLQHQTQLLLLDTTIDINLRDGRQYPVRLDVVNFGKGKDIYQLYGYSNLPGDNQIIFSFEVDGFISDSSSVGQLYIDTKKIDMTELPLNAFWEKTAIDSGSLEMKIWADWKNGDFQSAVSSLGIDDFQLSLLGEPQTKLERLNTYLVWQQQPDGWVFESQQTEIISYGRIWPDPSLVIKMKQEAKQQKYDFSASRLDIGIWTDLFLTNPNLENSVRQQLLRMDIYGFLNDVRVTADFDDSSLIDIRANAYFSELTWQPWNKIPGINNLTGQFEFNNNSGMLLIDSRHSILDYPSMFRWPFKLKTFSGRFSWELSNDLISLEISNVLMDVTDVRLQADGLMNIHRNSSTVDMNLYAELEQGNIAKTKNFLPTGIMQDNLVKYLDSSIMSGSLTSAQISLRGPSSKFPFTGPDGVFAINAQATNTRFLFMEDWPEVNQINADLWFVENSMDIRIDKAKSNGQNISLASAFIEDFSATPAILQIKTASHGVAVDAMDYINNSPLQDTVGKVFEVIPTTGPFQLGLDLTIPLSGDNDITVDGKIRLLGNSMIIDPVDMVIDNIEGVITLSDSLLFAEDISANLMGGKGNFSLIQQYDEQELLLTSIQGKGTLTTAGIRTVFPTWIPGMVEGKTNYRVTLSLPEVSDELPDADMSIDLAVSSDLEGISSQFPAPFDKKSEQSEPFILNFKQFSNYQQLFTASYSDLVDMKLHLQNQNDVSGRITLGGDKADISTENGIILTGKLDYFDLEPWLDYFIKSDISMRNIEFNDYDLLTISNLVIDDFKYLFMNFDQVSISAHEQKNSLLFNLNSDTIAGKIQIPDPDLEQPIAIELSNLIIVDQFPQTDKIIDHSIKTIAEIQKISNSQPLPPLKIYCEKCIYNEQLLGSIWINIKPLELGNEFTVKTKEKDTLNLDLKGKWQTDPFNNIITSVAGTLDAPEIDKLLQTFNIKTGIHDTDIKTKWSFNWHGDPLQFNFQTLNGKLYVDGGKGSQEDVSDKGARIFSLFSVGSVLRKLTLDFSDLFGEGFYYNGMDGNFTISDGIFSTVDFEIDGISADVEIKGSTDFTHNKIENCIRVTPELSSSLPVLAGWAIEPVTGIIVYLMSKIFQPVLKVVTSILYKVEGSLDNPDIIEVRKTAGTAIVDKSGKIENTTITLDSELPEFNCDKAF